MKVELSDKTIAAADKFIRNMKPGTVDVDKMKSNGAFLSNSHKYAILQVAKWTIDNDDLPGGDLLEISNCRRKIKKINLSGFKSVHHYYKNRKDNGSNEE